MKKFTLCLSAGLLMSVATVSYADNCIDYLNRCWGKLDLLGKAGLVGSAEVVGQTCLAATITPPAALVCAEGAVNAYCAVAGVSGSIFAACQLSSAKDIYEWLRAKLPELQQLQEQQKQQQQ